MEKILLAGGTGFIGTALAKHLVNAGYFVNILTKNPANKHPKHSNINYFEWNIENNFLDKTVFSDVKTLINLTGVGISDKRWSKKRKTEIIESRIKAIDLLYNTVVKENISLNQFISSSAVGYYGAVTSPYIFTEESQNGSDFLAFVCKEWENAALQFEKIGVPTGILRKGVVIGKHGGLYKKLTPLARMGINTALGTGEQFLPWIDIRDLVRLYRAILEKKLPLEILNATASQHVKMNELSKVMLHRFKKHSFLPNPPEFLIKLLFGEMAVMLLEGSKVSNEKLLKHGFSFEYDSIDKALCQE